MAEFEVSRILSCSTHYEVLKLEQPTHTSVFVDVQQVRRRYKELAILVHPDKNRATDAEAAFKRLSESYECLVDETSQRNYLQQVYQPKPGSKSTKRKYKYKRKRKPQSVPKGEEGPSLPKRRRTPEEIWQAFQREEEELARQQFHAKGFDRVYKSTVGATEAATTSTIPPEQQQHILASGLDEKASSWAKWSKPTSKRVKTESTASESEQKTGEVLTAAGSDTSLSLICCMLCRRKFPTLEALDRHETLSKLHLANLQAQQSGDDGP